MKLIELEKPFPVLSINGEERDIQFLAQKHNTPLGSNMLIGMKPHPSLFLIWNWKFKSLIKFVGFSAIYEIVEINIWPIVILR